MRNPSAHMFPHPAQNRKVDILAKNTNLPYSSLSSARYRQQNEEKIHQREREREIKKMKERVVVVVGSRWKAHFPLLPYPRRFRTGRIVKFFHEFSTTVCEECKAASSMRPFVAIGDEVWVGRPLDPPSHFQQAAFATGSRAQLEAGGGGSLRAAQRKEEKKAAREGGGRGAGGCR